MQLEGGAFEQWNAYAMRVGKAHCVESLSAASAVFCHTEGVVYVSISLTISEREYFLKPNLIYTIFQYMYSVQCYHMIRKTLPADVSAKKGGLEMIVTFVSHILDV